MRSVKLSIILLVLVLLTGCATTQKATMTPLELASLQSREYESIKGIVFPSVISVFQDLGYTVTNADMVTGLISAESATNSAAFFQLMTGTSSTNQTRATAFIEEIGGVTKVRLNFVAINQTSSAYGRSDRRDTPILDAQAYQAAFEKIETAIFVRSPS